MRLLPLAVITSVGLAAVAGSASAAKTLTLLTVQTAQHQGKTTFTFAERVYIAGSLVGHDQALCRFVFPKSGKSKAPTGANCQITITLNTGTINVTAPISFSSNSGPVEIVGGTGAYKGAHGTGTQKTAGKNKTRVVLNIQ